MTETYTAVEPVQGQFSARSPRSRRNRPCDFCRHRKVACKISTPGLPCELCLTKQHACTFEEAPRKRRRARTIASPVLVANMDPRTVPDYPIFGPDLPAQELGTEMNLDHDFKDNFDIFGSVPPSSPAGAGFQLPPQAPGRNNSPRDGIRATAATPPATTPTSTSTQHRRSQTAPSPACSGSSRRRSPSPLMRFVGSSGDLDTHLLAHRRYDAQNLSVSRHTHITYQRLQDLDRALAASKPPPMLAMSRDPSLSRGHEIVDTGFVQDAQQELDQLLSADTVARLSVLFARFVHPYLPIISKRALTAESDSLFDSPALLAAVAATASHFVAYDDVLCLEAPDPLSARRLYQLSWQLLQEDLASPRLSTVQVLILLLHRHLPDEPPLEGSMDSNIRGLLVSSSYGLGLHREPESWDTLPPEQRKLRKCLWWAAWVTEKWMAFSDGRPSQYNRDEYNVLPLDEADINALSDLSPAPSPFIYLNSLTFILDDVTRSYFTLAASERTSSSLAVSLQLAKSLRLRLKTWFDSLPLQLQPQGRRGMTDVKDVDDSELDASFSLNLAYMTTQLAIYRALIRPISLVALHCSTGHESSVSLDIDLDAAEAVVEGAISNARSLVSSLTNITTAEWDSFWPGWSRHNFASISTLLLHLYLLTSRFQAWPVSSPSSQSGSVFLASQFEKLQALMPKWRRHLLLASRGAGGRKGLTNLALLRLDALMNEWKGESSTPVS
ncbi:transcription factor domain-containing protein [Aspergillus undulatus]|uniref:transcription factor domain-containing protein n=1 Tax=Aspergillus undulatus TaxID=1810928 RepID=UPI003CCDA694